MFKLSPKFVGGFAYCVSYLLVKSFRVRIEMHPDVAPKNQYAYGFWHDKQLGPIMLMSRFGHEKRMGLVSQSRDGEMLTVWLKHLGYEVIRGSSSKKGMNSMVKLIAAAKQGYSVGITADGPRGPRHKAKSGLAFLAHKSGFPLLPMGVAYSLKWIFKRSWDKFQLPLPFSKVVIYLGKPMDMDDISELALVNEKIASALMEADAQAKDLLSLGKGLFAKGAPASTNHDGCQHE